MKRLIIFVLITSTMLMSCNKQPDQVGDDKDFNYVLEQFADLRILRYQVPEFEELSLQQKKLIYFLSQAAVCGRDILFDQNGKYNLLIRGTLENIYQTYTGDRETEEFAKFEEYLKRVWFSNGIYHHYSTDKFLPEFSQEYFEELVQNSDQEKFPVLDAMDFEETKAVILPVIFDPLVLPKKVNQDPEKDLVSESAVNFYNGVNQQEVESFYGGLQDPEDETPVSYGLNSRVVNQDGKVTELVWKSGGVYGEAIDQIVFWLEKAVNVAETPEQKEGIELLISYYKTGDLGTWDDYNVVWVKDVESHIDFINGFIETYSDPLGLKGTWESVVNFKNLEATKRTETISENAQWFEDNSPIDDRFKKKEVKGVTAKVITVAMLGGDCYPHTPIGINLPNADWIRKMHGSKSVTMENITYAYDQANLKTGALEEFAYDQEEIDLIRKYGSISDNLHTDLHECLGHGSGQLLPGVASDALKNYASPLEETRADLFALYYMMDPKMIELGLLPSLDAAKAQYISYIRNGIMLQLRRIEEGKNIEQAHMRNRQLIASWCFEKGKEDNVIEKSVKDGKVYYRVNDFEKLRNLFGELLIEVQRIKSEGDYEAGMELVEKYAVKVDPELHKEVLDRYEKLRLAPYSGFVNPKYELVKEGDEIVDVKVHYVDDFTTQMLMYSKDYSFLPVMN